MTIIEFDGRIEDLVDVVDDAIRQLREAGREARFILMGSAVYTPFCKAMAARNRRGVGSFQTYNHVHIVVDPFRDTGVCVVPEPDVTAREARGYRLPDAD